MITDLLIVWGLIAVITAIFLLIIIAGGSGD